MRWLLLSPDIMFRGVATLVHLSDRMVETSDACVGRPLDRAAKDAPTPREATMSRRPSRAHLLARQSPPRHQDSWRFVVDLGYYIGESAVSTGQVELSLCPVLSATNHGLGMTLGYPDLSCAVPSGDTALTAQTVRLPDVLRRCGTFPRYGNLFSGILPGLKKFRGMQKKN